jgi:hypothetical protein
VNVVITSQTDEARILVQGKAVAGDNKKNSARWCDSLHYSISRDLKTKSF